MARSRSRKATSSRLILDSGAVIALARLEPRARAALTAAHEAGASVLVPAVVVTETTRGGARDAGVNRILKAVGQIAPTTEAIARIAGRLLGKAGSEATIDALIVAEAAQGGGVVLTGDQGDLAPLAAYAEGVVIQTP